MSLTGGHRGGTVPQEVADRGQGNALHDQPRGKGMAEVVEVKVGQPGQLTGSLKGVPNIVVTASQGVVEHQWRLVTPRESAEQTPERFVERERLHGAVLGLS